MSLKRMIALCAAMACSQALGQWDKLLKTPIRFTPAHASGAISTVAQGAGRHIADKAAEGVGAAVKAGMQSRAALIFARVGDDAAEAAFKAVADLGGDGVANGIDRVKDSLAALRATPKTGGVDSAVAGMLDSTIPTMKNFHALRNLDPKSLTAAQKTGLAEIRNALGTPGAGTRCQKVIKLDDMQIFLSKPDTKISGYITKYDDVADLNTVDELREGLRLDYSSNGYIGVDEVAIIEFNMPMPAHVTTPLSNAPTYPATGNGFTGTRYGRAIPESIITTPFTATEGTKLFWLDSTGNKVLFGTFINGAWVQ